MKSPRSGEPADHGSQRARVGRVNRPAVEQRQQTPGPGAAQAEHAAARTGLLTVDGGAAGDAEVVDLSAPANETRKPRQVAGGWEWEAFSGWRRRQLPDVGPSAFLPVEWFSGCSGSSFSATEEEAWEDAGRRALAWGREQAGR